MYYQHFLGVDVLELAARVSDAAAVQAKFEVPTMQASECVVCHKTLDPVAGLFQDYWRFADQGVYGRRKGGWLTDMFPPGLEGEDLPAQMDRSQWPALKERFAAIFKTRTCDEWCEVFDGTDACVSPVLTPDEAARHQQLVERNTYVVRDGIRQPAPAPRFSRTPAALTTPPRPPAAGLDALPQW